MSKKPKKKIVVKKAEEFTYEYLDLVGEYPDWEGLFDDKKSRDESQKNPRDMALVFGFLSRIVMLLAEIRNELKRKREIN